MRKKLWIGVFLFLISGFLPSGRALADDNTAVLIKLDKIIGTQDRIERELNEIKAELNVVKVRASQG